jgi:hypothetical protein
MGRTRLECIDAQPLAQTNAGSVDAVLDRQGDRVRHQAVRDLCGGAEDRIDIIAADI